MIDNEKSLEHVGENSGKVGGWEGVSSLGAHGLTGQLQLGLVPAKESGSLKSS